MSTDEDSSASPDERIARFGQADHVRYYGRDFEKRLSDAGLAVRGIKPTGMLSPWEIERFGLNEKESVWICSTSQPAPSETGSDLHLLDRLIAKGRSISRRHSSNAAVRSLATWARPVIRHLERRRRED